MPIAAKDNGFVRPVRALASAARAGQIDRVPPPAIAGAPRAPYALEPTTFPLPALAAMAGRAPLGGPREIALACLLIGRLVADVVSGQSLLTEEQRRTRARNARRWLGTAAVPPPVRAALARLADAAAEGDSKALQEAMEGVMAVTANLLDPGPRLELGRLTQTIAE